MKRQTASRLLFLLLCCLPVLSSAAIIEVGPGKAYKTPSQAAKAAKDGDRVMIQAGYYLGDVAVWPQDDLRIQATGGTVYLLSNGKTAEDKAIWVIRGDRVSVTGIDFSGAHSKYLNGAGIRYEGDDLTVRHCSFHDNQMGLLSGDYPDSKMRIENSEFYRNSVDYRKTARLGHNIYIGAIAQFILRDSHVHSAHIGHQVKSRAKQNLILYNRIGDESGRSSYLIDLPMGGKSLIMGNLLHKSQVSENSAAIAFAGEYKDNSGQELFVVHNTLASERSPTTLVHTHVSGDILVANNLLQGDIETLKGIGLSRSNLVMRDAGLRDSANMDFHLTDESLAIDTAVPRLKSLRGKQIRPTRQYVHPRRSEARIFRGNPDIGALEWQPEHSEKSPDQQ